MAQVFPAPRARRGQPVLQVIGICLNCFKKCEMVADLTGQKNATMAPTTCSAECELEARKQLG